MNYPTRVTYCMPLIRNLKKYANANYIVKDGDIYIDVEDISERIYIEDIEMYQKATFKYYNLLIEKLENNK